MRARATSPAPVTSSTTPRPTSTGPATTERTGQAIVGTGETAIPAHDFVRVVRADPRCPGVLYAGTETGLYVSLDDGESWRRWRSNFPVVPVYDLKVEDDELAVATHGRSFWIQDDLTPLRGIAAQAASGERSVFFSPERGLRWEGGPRNGLRYRRRRLPLPAPARMAPAPGG